MTKERAIELLNQIISYVAAGNNTSGQIEELTKYGFTADELVKDFGYSKDDVEYETGEEVIADTSKKYKLHARVTREIEVTEDQIEKLYNLLTGSVEHNDINDILNAFTDGIDAGYYEKGYLPIEWAMTDIDEQYRDDIFESYAYAGNDFVLETGTKMNVYLTTYDGYIVAVENGKVSAYEGAALCPSKVKKYLEEHKPYQLDYYHTDAIARGLCN